MSWSPAQYTQFESERNQPVFDLLSRIQNRNVQSTIDIGCGPGNSTELLQQRFPKAIVSGIDSSPEMIEAARRRMPETCFEVADIAGWNGDEKFDLIFSNAVLQWLPNHETLLPKLLERLAPGGTLAVQIPDNLEEPVHQLMRRVAEDARWAATLVGASARMAHRHPAEWYYGELTANGAAVEVWRTTYFHPLAGADALVEWFKGTGLRPYLQLLDKSEQFEFLEIYRAALGVAYPALPNGTVLLPFPRLFFTATLV